MHMHIYVSLSIEGTICSYVNYIAYLTSPICIYAKRKMHAPNLLAQFSH